MNNFEYLCQYDIGALVDLLQCYNMQGCGGCEFNKYGICKKGYDEGDTIMWLRQHSLEVK